MGTSGNSWLSSDFSWLRYVAYKCICVSYNEVSMNQSLLKMLRFSLQELCDHLTKLENRASVLTSTSQSYWTVSLQTSHSIKVSCFLITGISVCLASTPSYFWMGVFRIADWFCWKLFVYSWSANMMNNGSEASSRLKGAANSVWLLLIRYPEPFRVP